MAIFLALGSNLDDREQYLRFAISKLNEGACSLVRASRIYETVPVGGPEGQQNYLNQVLEVEWEGTPFELLELCQVIESKAGRDRSGGRWSSRTLDIDLLMFHDREISEPGLVIPHPELSSRRFVLEPLSELVSALVVPGTQRTVNDFLKRFLLGSTDVPLRVFGSAA